MRRGEYLDIAELLRGNMELECRGDISDVPTNTLSLTSQTNRREVPHLLSLGQCLGMYYAAVLCSSYPVKVQQLYAY